MPTEFSSCRWIFLTCAVMASGCEGLRDPNPQMARLFESSADRQQQEQEQRQLYQVDRNPAAMNWLLANRVSAGMTIADVEQVLGEDSERQWEDQRFKKSGGLYRRDDKVYKWGPDADGRSVFLVFREGRLAHFDPDEFR